MPEPGDRPPVRWPFALLAYICVGFAFVGVVLPGIPTVPFLLLAAWAASRGSQRLHDWLYDHARFGPALVQWRDHRAISRRSKLTAIALLATSWLLLLWTTSNIRLLLPLTALFLIIATFLLTRPEA